MFVESNVKAVLHCMPDSNQKKALRAFRKGAGVQNHLLLLPCFQPFPGKGLRQKEKLKEKPNRYPENGLLYYIGKPEKASWRFFTLSTSEP